jgi:hypothetical protein
VAGTVDIGGLRGVIELKDEYTSTLGLVATKVFEFSETQAMAFGAITAGAALVAASFTAIGVAAAELGSRGADVNDVASTLQHFAGSAEQADAIMQQLRKGTLDTVDNFSLAKDAARLLSVGVKLTADDFGTLSSAAFVLQNRGLGPTKDMLNLVSDALVTGRTKQLAHSLGVIDAGDAEARYAEKLGLTKDLLTDEEKVEAKRIQIMDMLGAAVKDAGVQQRDFGEQLEAARTFAVNWVDDLGKAVATSPVLAAGMKAVGEAVSDAFGGSKQSSIQAVTGFIEDSAIMATNFGLGAVEMARVVNVAWSVVKTAVLGTETVIMGIASGITEAISAVASVGENLHIIPEGSAEKVHQVSVELNTLTDHLEDETAEAAKGIVGHSEFDKTLDHLGGTLYKIQDAMVAAKKGAQEIGEAVVDVAAKNAATIAKTQAEIEKLHGDQDKLWKIQKKSIDETADLWDQYYQVVAEGAGTSKDAQIAAIDKWREHEIAALDASDRNFNEHYDAINAVADAKIANIGKDWDSVKDKSLESLGQQRDAAYETYSQMIGGSLHFSRDVLDAQYQKYQDLKEAARGMGEAFVKAQNDSMEATKKNVEELEKLEAAERKAREEANKVGGSQEVGSSNFQAQIESYVTNMGLNKGAVGVQQYHDPYQMAHQGYSFAEIIKYAFNPQFAGALPPATGPRIPGFVGGGLVDIGVGEAGPETIRVPIGSMVFPHGIDPSTTSGQTIQVNNVLTLDGRVVHRSTSQHVMQGAKITRKFTSAT